MKKRGQAGIIATVLIILVVVIIAVIISSFAFNFMEKQKKSSEPLIQSNLGATIDDVKIENTGSLANLPPLPSGESVPEQKISIIITRTDNEETQLTGVRFKFTDKSGNSYNYDINNPPEETSIPKTYEILNTDVGINDFNNLEKISLSFILKSGTQTQILYEKELG